MVDRIEIEASFRTDASTKLSLQQLDILDRTVRFAHEQNPLCWAIGQIRFGSIILWVGSYAALEIRDEYNCFLVAPTPEDPELQAVDPLHVTSKYKNYSGSWIHGLDNIQFLALFTHLESSSHQAITELASTVKSRPTWIRNHQPDVLDWLESTLDQQIPRPDYQAARSMDSIPYADLQPPAVQRRYWKVSPGFGGAQWDDFRSRSIVALHHGKPIDLMRLSTDRAAFIAEVQEQNDETAAAARSLWTFAREMAIGDVVLAYKAKAIVGMGEITGDYQSVIDDFDFSHRRTVNWTSLDKISIDHLKPNLRAKLQQRSTIVHLTEQAFNEITGKLEVPVEPMALIQGRFAASGLHYTDSQIATFYTSLQTKGFVVLSGISGTGKSKIATGFVEMFPSPSVTSAPLQDTAGMISISVKPYMRTYKRVILPARQVDLLPSLEVGQQVEMRISLDGIRGTGRLEHRAHTGESSITVLYFRGELGRAFASLDIGTKLYLKPTLDEEGDSIQQLELLHGENAVDTVITSSSTNSSSTANYLFLSVRPDWRDSTSLLGYYNPLTQTYEWTDFLHFLIRAQKSFEAKDGLAWFVILDEMNLAHLEYYFADLLSVIESGRDDAGWTREPLRLTYPETLDDEVPPPKLKLPPNLYIIGTVNMDETTHAFSPKVLDRAFTIELADVDFSNYPIASAGSAAVTLTDVQKVALLQAFTREGRFALIDKAEIGEVVARHPRIRDDLQILNTLLQPHRMHFGYRVFDEICQYLHNNDLNDMMPFDDAFDQAVFMKVLPKFTGSRARLQSPLHGVLAWAIDPGKISAGDVERVVTEFNQFYQAKASEAWTMAIEPAFPTVAGRVRDMLVALERDGFVSFG